jgi:hypothetical protein
MRSFNLFCWVALLTLPVSAQAVDGLHTSTTSVVSSSATWGSTWRSVQNTAFKEGEYLRFAVSWGVITAGYSTLEVREAKNLDGRPAYHIVSQAKSVGMVDTFFNVNDLNEAWLDKESLTTVRYEKHIREGKYRVDETGVFDQVLRRYAVQTYRIDKATTTYKEGDLPTHVLDVLGSLYYIRTQQLAVGATYTIDVFSSAKVWPLSVKVKKRETIKVKAGKFDCFRIEPVLREPGIFISKGKKLEVWLTADERRMPVRMRSEVVIGHVSADLVSHEFRP